MPRPDLLLTRRDLLQASSLAVAAAAFPWPAQAVLGCSTTPDACGDWQLDDICNTYPPYSFRVDAPTGQRVAQASAAPSADWHWIG